MATKIRWHILADDNEGETTRPERGQKSDRACATYQAYILAYALHLELAHKTTNLYDLYIRRCRIMSLDKAGDTLRECVPKYSYDVDNIESGDLTRVSVRAEKN